MRLAMNAGIAICAVMIVFNLYRSRKRGWSSIFLAIGFAAFGGLLYAIDRGASTPILIGCTVVLVFALVADAVARIDRQSAGAPKS